MQVPTASALVPSVSLTTSLSGSHYVLNVTVDHPATPALSASHYVDQVQIVTTNTSGSKWVNLTMAGAELYAAQHNVTFSFSYDVGSLALNTTISGTAHCTVHGWGTPGTATAGPALATKPSAPQSLVATAGNASVLLTWNAPSSTGSAPVTNYTIYRGTTSGSLTAIKSIFVNTTSYNDTTVTNGITYYYAVTATNSVGESVKSTEVSATPTAGGTPPATPADNTMLIVAIVLIIVVVIIIAAVMMRRKGGAEKPKE